MAEPVYPPPPSDALNTIEDMRDAVFFDEPGRAQRVRRFWILLVLSSAIAASGVVGDSTATVIGAMIVAPMMLPIQGTMLATVLGERVNFGRSLFTMIAGAAAAIAIGYLVGLLVVVPETAATNPQIAERATPDLMSLFGALATGAVASIALVRKDISDTLPGVAIAISLVPPLVVVGVAAESADYAAAIGSLLLFVANVAAILGTGVVVMALYRVQRWGSFAIPGTAPVTTATGTIRPLATVNRRRSHITIALLLVLVAIPLTLSTYRTVTTTLQSSDVDGVARSWADDEDLEVLDIATASPGYVVRVTGGDSVPDVAPLRTALEADDIDPSTVAVEWVPTTRVNVGG